MLQASFETLALVGAMVSAQFAGLTLLFARRRHAAPALRWWAASLVAESLRLGVASLATFLPAAALVLIGEGGDAVVALLVLAGTLAYIDGTKHLRLLLPAVALAGAAVAGGSLLPNAIHAAAVVLTALAASCLAATAWLFWRQYRIERRAYNLAILPPALLSAFHLLE
ncbi:MAG: hypothetical protein ACE5GS_16595, partial [Kiloniellaceae bacterium]